jgi:hypothetical protein
MMYVRFWRGGSNYRLCTIRFLRYYLICRVAPDDIWAKYVVSYGVWDGPRIEVTAP